jgi:hypothetical protein
MPLTAVYAGDLSVDATATLPADLDWGMLHRARPRAPLTCKECGHGLHAKVSSAGLRFFAHDVGAGLCSLTGESLAHRLLKVELAVAIRAAGWRASLEVAGDGFRADVLATSPDGQTHVAWEAQLASITIDEVTRRTSTMSAAGVSVCWVTDRDALWLGHVPSVRVASQDVDGLDDPAKTGAGQDARQQELVILDGVAAFAPAWCSDRDSCDDGEKYGYGGRLGPCPGHGTWIRPAQLSLEALVAGVLAGTVRPVKVGGRPMLRLWRHAPGGTMWTTQTHFHAYREQEAQAAAYQLWWQDQQADATLPLRPMLGDPNRSDRDPDTEALEPNGFTSVARRRRAVLALLARQLALVPDSVSIVAHQSDGTVVVGVASPEWGMGAPLVVHDEVRAVLSPVPSRVRRRVRHRLAAVTVVVASEGERRRLRQVCVPGQEILCVPVVVRRPDAIAGSAVVDKAMRALFKPQR